MVAVIGAPRRNIVKKPQKPIAPESPGIASALGTRLRSLRKQQKMTLVELAKAAGVDIATISRIETGRMTGTLESHVRLASSLGVKVTELYAGIEEARTKDAIAVQTPSQGQEAYVHHSGKWSTTVLTKDILQKKLMPVLLAIEPNGVTTPEETKIGVEKFVYVLEGQIEAEAGGKAFALKRGSSLYLDSSLRHQFRNTGTGIAKCLVVVTPPTL